MIPEPERVRVIECPRCQGRASRCDGCPRCSGTGQVIVSPENDPTRFVCFISLAALGVASDPEARE